MGRARFGWLRSFCEYGNEPLGSIKKKPIVWKAEWLSAFQRISCTVKLWSYLGCKISYKEEKDIISK
jgi:hypothetical protein